MSLQVPCYQVVGKADSTQFAFCERLLSLLKAGLNLTQKQIKIVPVTNEQWESSLAQICRVYGFTSFLSKYRSQQEAKDEAVTAVVVFHQNTGRLVGGAAELEAELLQKFSIQCDMSWSELAKIPPENVLLLEKQAQQ
jgi:hypothetical protein